MILNLLHPIVSGSVSSSLSDEDLIEKYKASQQTAFFDVLYERYSDKVYAKCISMLKDNGLAEDAVQDIFMKVLLSISKFRGASKFSTWLYSITYNFCIDKIRRRNKRRSLVKEVDDIGNLDGVSEDAGDGELLETSVRQMKAVLDKLKAGDKAVLLMKYQDEMTIKDMTLVLDMSESAIKMKIKRAKERFKREHRVLFAS